MQRRSIIQALGTAGLFVLPAVGASAKSNPNVAPVMQALDPGRWSVFNCTELNSLMQTVGKASKAYNPSKKPYAVFDWDNTCIMNDCQESLLVYQIDHLAFKLTPAEFAEVIRTGVPNGAFKVEAGFKNTDGKAVLMEDIADDVDAGYRWIYANYKGFAGAMTLEQIQATEQFKDFRAKLRYMFEAILESHPIEVGYKWVIYLYKNMTPIELQALAEASNDYNLGEAMRKTKLLSSEKIPGKAGQVAVNHFYGLRIYSEIVNLMNTLRSNGFDVYISTASIDDVVRVFAGNPKYGYNVPAENVIGLRLEMQDGKYTNVYRKDWMFNWGPGKTVGIQRELVARKGYGPALVAGDSDGDAWMLKDFVDTKIGLIVNRVKTGEIGERSKSAAAEIGKHGARYILQGINENTGLFMPDEKSLKYGKTEAKLLA